MVGIAAVGYALCIVIVVIIGWLIVRRWPIRTEQLPPVVQELLNAARRRALIGIAFAGTGFVALFAAGLTLRDLLGLPFALAPALGGSAGLLLYSATPPRVVAVGPDTQRAASLTPRTPFSYLPRPGALMLLVTIAAQLAFLIFTGTTSSTDESGRRRVIAFQEGEYASAAGPYPGWFYGVPLIIATVILAAATLFALWRVSSTPALPLREHAAINGGWRKATNKIIIAISAAALLMQFGGVVFQAGTALTNAYFDGVPPIWRTAGQLFQIVGLAMPVGSIATTALAALWALTLPEGSKRQRSRKAAQALLREEIAP